MSRSQSYVSDEQNEQDDVREGDSEIYHLK